jgi:hypothetical protein
VSHQNKYVQNIRIAKKICSKFDNHQFKKCYINCLHWTNCLWLYETHQRVKHQHYNISPCLSFHHTKLLCHQVYSIICPWVAFLVLIKFGRWHGPLHMMPIILHVNLGLTKSWYNNGNQHFPESILWTTSTLWLPHRNLAKLNFSHILVSIKMPTGSTSYGASKGTR